MRKHLKFLPLIISALLLGASLAYFSGCATFLTNLFSPYYEQFELLIEENKITINLPNEVPSMESAIIGGGGSFNAKVSYVRYCLGTDSGHDHIDFVYTKTDVIALVWIKTNETEFEKRYIGWIYLKGKPIPAPIDKVNKLLEERGKSEKLPGSVLFKELGKDLAELQRLIIELNKLRNQDL